MPTWLLFMLTVLANALANVFIKVGAGKGYGWTGLTNVWVIGGALLFVTNFPIYTLLLQRLKLSLAYPLVTTTAFALAIVVSAFFLKERLTLNQYIGLAILPLSLWLLTPKN